MRSLKQRLAKHGFTSNEDYQYPVQCLLSSSVEHLRCLNAEGDSGRRKTAFAHALAHALEYDQVLYYEFTGITEPPPPVRVPKPPEEEEDVGEPPVAALDRIISEACALSEGDKTILILDQLHKAEFKQHLRLTEFIQSKEWSYGDITLKANPQNLLLFLVSDEPLYHSLQHLSFNIWVDSGMEAHRDVTCHDLGLAENAQGMLDALRAIFDALNVSPTLGEFKKVAHDIHVNINDIENLKTSIYGWVEGVDRKHLMSPYMHQVFEKHMPAISAYLGIDDTAQPGIVLRHVDEDQD